MRKYFVAILNPLPYKFQTQSQKTQGFCVADFPTLSDERRSRSKIFLLFILIKEPCIRKFERLARSKLLGISQTELEDFCFCIASIRNLSQLNFSTLLLARLPRLAGLAS